LGRKSKQKKESDQEGRNQKPGLLYSKKKIMGGNVPTGSTLGRGRGGGVKQDTERGTQREKKTKKIGLQVPRRPGLQREMWNA